MFLVLGIFFGFVILVCLISGIVGAFVYEDAGIPLAETPLGYDEINLQSREQEYRNNIIAMAAKKGVL